MEIEAKFILPSAEVLRRLQTLDQLAGYLLGECRSKSVHDLYLDTPGRKLLAAGYALRQRDQDGRFLITLKALPTAETGEDPIHHREELEIELPELPSPERWPAGMLRDRVLSLIDDEPLHPLVQLHQRRTVRPVLQGERPFALLSLDEVHLTGREGKRTEYELEIELEPEEPAAALAPLVAELQQEWHLLPQPHSKLERALAMLENPRSAPGPNAQPLPLEKLLDTYRVDRRHARTVADHALALFDALQPIHGLPPESRSLIETAALLHNVGLETDPENHHVAGRDILLAHPPAELSADSQRIVALTTLLHRKRISEKKLDKLTSDPLMTALPADRREEALILAALIRAADGLDYSQSGSTRIVRVRPRPGETEIEVAGPQAEGDAARANEKTDLWMLKFATPMHFVPVTPIENAPPPAAPGISPDDSMAEAARKTFYYQLHQMLHHEPGTRDGQDPEALHRMRVATRRMRAAADYFAEHLDSKAYGHFLKGLRRAGRTLGTVRDLDVFHIKVRTYLAALPAAQQGDLDPLLAVWETEHRQARKALLDYLDSADYAQFVEEFNAYLLRPVAPPPPRDPPQPYRVRDHMPVNLYRGLAAIRAYDPWIAGGEMTLPHYHQLRISFKGLRYGLEFFREVLGPEAGAAIETIKAVQDHLGDLQDAVVASARLRDFLVTGRWTQLAVPAKIRPEIPTEPILAPGVATYLAVRQAEIQTLIDTFPALWAQIQAPEFRARLAGAVAAL